MPTLCPLSLPLHSLPGGCSYHYSFTRFSSTTEGGSRGALRGLVGRTGGVGGAKVEWLLHFFCFSIPESQKMTTGLLLDSLDPLSPVSPRPLRPSPSPHPIHSLLLSLLSLLSLFLCVFSLTNRRAQPRRARHKKNGSLQHLCPPSSLPLFRQLSLFLLPSSNSPSSNSPSSTPPPPFLHPSFLHSPPPFPHPLRTLSTHTLPFFFPFVPPLPPHRMD